MGLTQSHNWNEMTLVDCYFRVENVRISKDNSKVYYEVLVYSSQAARNAGQRYIRIYASEMAFSLTETDNIIKQVYTELKTNTNAIEVDLTGATDLI